MNARLMLAAPIAAAALLAPGFAAAEILYESTYYVPPRSDTIYYVESVPATSTTDYVYVEPVTPVDDTVHYYSPAITVNAARASQDELITNDVAAEIASDPYIHGRVGVDTFNREVTLTGRVATPGQRLRADYAAHRVDDVAAVHNQLRTSVGDY